MWTSRLVLMWSIMPASVVVLPDPVGPVTSTSPRGSSASGADDRRQAELVQRDRADADPAEHQAGASRADRNALTRNRPTPAME